jgi:hypothetical protein
MSDAILFNVKRTVDNEFDTLMELLYGKNWRTNISIPQRTDLYKMFCCGWLACASVNLQSAERDFKSILKPGE